MATVYNMRDKSLFLNLLHSKEAPKDILSHVNNVEKQRETTILPTLQFLKSAVLFTSNFNGLKNLINVFIGKMSNDMESLSLTKDLKILSDSLVLVRDFWALCSSQKTALTGKVFSDGKDCELTALLPSLASIYLDLFILSTRENGNTHKLSKRLSSWLFFDMNERCLKTCLLEVTQCNQKGVRMLQSVLKKLLQQPRKDMTNLDYLLHMVVLRRWSLVAEDDLNDLVNEALNVKAPKQFVSWMQKVWPQAVEHVPQDKSFKGHRVTELLMALDELAVNELIEVLANCLLDEQNCGNLETGSQATGARNDPTELLFVIDTKGSAKLNQQENIPNDEPGPPRKKQKENGTKLQADDSDKTALIKSKPSDVSKAAIGKKKTKKRVASSDDVGTDSQTDKSIKKRMKLNKEVDLKMPSTSTSSVSPKAVTAEFFLDRKGAIPGSNKNELPNVLEVKDKEGRDEEETTEKGSKKKRNKKRKSQRKDGNSIEMSKGPEKQMEAENELSNVLEIKEIEGRDEEETKEEGSKKKRKRKKKSKREDGNSIEMVEGPEKQIEAEDKLPNVLEVKDIEVKDKEEIEEKDSKKKRKRKKKSKSEDGNSIEMVEGPEKQIEAEDKLPNVLEVKDIEVKDKEETEEKDSKKKRKRKKKSKSEDGNSIEMVEGPEKQIEAEKNDMEKQSDINTSGVAKKVMEQARESGKTKVEKDGRKNKNKLLSRKNEKSENESEEASGVKHTSNAKRDGKLEKTDISVPSTPESITDGGDFEGHELKITSNNDKINCAPLSEPITEEIDGMTITVYTMADETEGKTGSPTLVDEKSPLKLRQKQSSSVLSTRSRSLSESFSGSSKISSIKKKKSEVQIQSEEIISSINSPQKQSAMDKSIHERVALTPPQRQSASDTLTPDRSLRNRSLSECSAGSSKNNQVPGNKSGKKNKTPLKETLTPLKSPLSNLGDETEKSKARNNLKVKDNHNKTNGLDIIEETSPESSIHIEDDDLSSTISDKNDYEKEADKRTKVLLPRTSVNDPINCDLFSESKTKENDGMTTTVYTISDEEEEKTDSPSLVDEKSPLKSGQKQSSPQRQTVSDTFTPDRSLLNRSLSECSSGSSKNNRVVGNRSGKKNKLSLKETKTPLKSPQSNLGDETEKSKEEKDKVRNNLKDHHDKTKGLDDLEEGSHESSNHMEDIDISPTNGDKNDYEKEADKIEKAQFPRTSNNDNINCTPSSEPRTEEIDGMTITVYTIADETEGKTESPTPVDEKSPLKLRQKQNTPQKRRASDTFTPDRSMRNRRLSECSSGSSKNSPVAGNKSGKKNKTPLKETQTPLESPQRFSATDNITPERLFRTLRLSLSSTTKKSKTTDVTKLSPIGEHTEIEIDNERPYFSEQEKSSPVRVSEEDVGLVLSSIRHSLKTQTMTTRLRSKSESEHGKGSPEAGQHKRKRGNKSLTSLKSPPSSGSLSKSADLLSNWLRKSPQHKPVFENVDEIRDSSNSQKEVSTKSPKIASPSMKPSNIASSSNKSTIASPFNKSPKQALLTPKKDEKIPSSDHVPTKQDSLVSEDLSNTGVLTPKKAMEEEGSTLHSPNGRKSSIDLTLLAASTSKKKRRSSLKQSYNLRSKPADCEEKDGVSNQVPETEENKEIESATKEKRKVADTEPSKTPKKKSPANIQVESH